LQDQQAVEENGTVCDHTSCLTKKPPSLRPTAQAINYIDKDNKLALERTNSLPLSHTHTAYKNIMTKNILLA
jgi:hypothetical protein